MTTTVAAALVVVAQVVVAPASCCLVRGAVSGDAACCRPASPAHAAGGCCRGLGCGGAGETLASPAAPVPGPDECLWCSAEPKAAAYDRVTPPVPEAGFSAGAFAAPQPAVAASEAAYRLGIEPFHRTALAACAWLCVWRK